MKKVIGMALVLSLAGCAGQTPSTISSTAKQIQDYTRLACSFVPTVATIAAIFASGTSASFTTIAKDICDAVTNVPLADGGTRNRKAYGVVIKGNFEK